jgi:hypothetical protein
MQGIFGGFCKLTDKIKIGNTFLKKIVRAGSDLAGRRRAGPAQIQRKGGAGGEDSNLPMGQVGQRRGSTEPVRGKLGSAIK